MTGRERLLCVLNGYIPDRVPVSFFIQEEFLSYFFTEKKQVDRVKDAVEFAKLYDLDIMPRGREFEFAWFMRKSFPNWQVNVNEKREADIFYRITEITTPEGTLKQVEAGPYSGKVASGIHLSTVEYLLHDEKAFYIFDKYVPNIDMDTILRMKEYTAYIKKLVGEQGIAVPWGWAGVFNQAANYRNIQDLLIDPYINKEFYDAYMKKLTELTTEYNQAFADAGLDCLGIQGNIANSSMVGPDFFNENILPYEKKLVSAIKDTGTFTLYHNCGNAKVLQPSYAEMGLDVWETVAEPPLGDNSLLDAKKLVGGKITLAGNLNQVDFLKKASLEDIDKKVSETVNVGKSGGRYIFAGSDYLEKDTPIENITRAVEAAKREGKY